MAKIGRNEPCPCGSGKKYKACCLSKDETAAIAAAPKAESRDDRRARRTAFNAELAEYDDDDDVDLAEHSNAVGDLINAGRIDEAEQAANDLVGRFPDVHDGYMWLAMIFEARGDDRRAADYYRKASDIVREHPDCYDPGFDDDFLEQANRLDPPPT